MYISAILLRLSVFLWFFNFFYDIAFQLRTSNFTAAVINWPYYNLLTDAIWFPEETSDVITICTRQMLPFCGAELGSPLLKWPEYEKWYVNFKAFLPDFLKFIFDVLIIR